MAVRICDLWINRSKRGKKNKSNACFHFSDEPIFNSTEKDDDRAIRQEKEIVITNMLLPISC